MAEAEAEASVNLLQQFRETRLQLAEASVAEERSENNAKSNRGLLKTAKSDVLFCVGRIKEIDPLPLTTVEDVNTLQVLRSEYSFSNKVKIKTSDASVRIRMKKRLEDSNFDVV